jgi:putative FmdB family regulatory protein
MPLYEYFCRDCDTYFERRRPASEYAAAAVCERGHTSPRRVVSLFATISSGGSARPEAAGCACGGGACGCGH